MKNSRYSSRTVHRPAASVVSISINSVVTDGNQATVRASRNDTVSGQSMNVHQTFTLTKGGAGWTIREIGQ